MIRTPVRIRPPSHIFGGTLACARDPSRFGAWPSRTIGRIVLGEARFGEPLGLSRLLLRASAKGSATARIRKDVQDARIEPIGVVASTSDSADAPPAAPSSRAGFVANFPQPIAECCV